MLPYIGGKSYLANWIISNFPDDYQQKSLVGSLENHINCDEHNIILMSTPEHYISKCIAHKILRSQ